MRTPCADACRSRGEWEHGIKDIVGEPLCKFSELAFRAKRIAGLAIVFESRVEARMSDFGFHWAVLVLVMKHINGKH